jgi:phytoene synthase
VDIDSGAYGVTGRNGAGVVAAAMPVPGQGPAWSAPDAARWVQARLAASGSSFFWAMRLLPKDRRAAMFAVYAFCRAVDDIADGAAPAPDKMAALAAWRVEIGALFQGAPHHPATVAVARAVPIFGLRKDDFLAVIDGMEMDVAGRMVAPSLVELELYCARAACAVGRLSAPIFGLNRDVGEALARSLGQALQLTNVLRDLAEDAAVGRLYLPHEVLARNGIAARQPAAVLSHPALARACAEVSVMAEAHFAEARALLRDCPRGPARPARAMCAVYARLLARLKVRGFAPDLIGHPIRMGRGQKFLIALGACLR